VAAIGLTSPALCIWATTAPSRQPGEATHASSRIFLRKGPARLTHDLLRTAVPASIGAEKTTAFPAVCVLVFRLKNVFVLVLAAPAIGAGRRATGLALRVWRELNRVAGVVARASSPCRSPSARYKPAGAPRSRAGPLAVSVFTVSLTTGFP
jgi:hypothetical protein